MKLALLGLHQSGKTTLLSVISSKPICNQSASSIQEEVVSVPDQRLEWLTTMYKPKKTVAATIDCLDVPGFSFIDSAARNAARHFISEVKTVDMFVLVVRAFKSDSVPAYRDEVNAIRDINELQTELLLADLEMVSTRIERLETQIKKSPKTIQQDKAELAVQLKLQECLESNKPASSAIDNEQDLELIRSLNLLTLKPLMIVVNTNDFGEVDTANYSSVLNSNIPVVSLSASIESELVQLEKESREEFMKELGISEPGANKFVRSCYQAMGLISFLTVGPDEVRAWAIRKGSTALDAAGKIHTDIKRGFIRAETMSYEELHQLGSEKAMKAAGKMRLEGKTYVVQDGDIMNFRFNV